MARKKPIEKLKPYILGVANVIEIKQDEINQLNVFPVPDGDTGTNMASTWAGVVKEVRKLSPNAEMDEIWTAIENGAGKNARGNSGVILSYIIKGAVSVLRNAKRLDTKTLEEALVAGNKFARSMVPNPQEGTILTVISAMAEAAGEARRKRKNVRDAMGMIAEAATATVNATPEMLDKLLGKIDAGGYGLSLMFWAAYDMITGKSNLESVQFLGVNEAAPVKHEHEAAWVEGTPRYDVQGLVTPSEEVDLDALYKFLGGIGDSELALAIGDFVRIHVHTETPELVLGMLNRLGEIVEFAVENMRLQTLEKHSAPPVEEKKALGVAAVALGSGIRELLKDLGVDEIVDGGQTANPSVEAIAEAIRRVNAPEVLVLPSNRNIVLAAQAACDLCTEKTCRVVPSRDVPETIAAMMVFEPDRGLEENVEKMTGALEKIVSGAVTTAIRDSRTTYGHFVREGAFIGVSGSNVLTTDTDLVEAAIQLAYELATDVDPVLAVTLYVGEALDGDEETLERLKAKFESSFPDADVSIFHGKQPVYHLLIGME